MIKNWVNVFKSPLLKVELNMENIKYFNHLFIYSCRVSVLSGKNNSKVWKK